MPSLPLLTGKHSEGFINISGSSVKGTSYSLSKKKPVSNTPSFGSCSNVYCHSTVQAANGTTAGVTDTTPLWGAAGPITCTTYCHKNEPPTNNHAQHISLNTGYGYSCATCHTAQTVTTHSNGTINMLVIGTNAKYKIAGTAYTAVPPATSLALGSCTTTACHGQSSPVWGTVGNASKCLKCHGVRAGTFVNISSANIAPGGTGTDTGNATGTTIRGGTHQEHLTAATGMSGKVRCGECHAIVNNTTAAIATHLNFSTATMTFGSLAKANAATPSVARTSGIISCSNLYCHGAKMPGGDTTGTNKTPAWNSTAYLPATVTSAACSTCHGFPPPTAAGHPGSITIPAGFPTTAAIGTTCSCHSNVRTTGNSYATMFTTPTQHINAVVEVSGGHSFPYPGATHMGAAGASPWSSCVSVSCHANTAGGTYPVAAGVKPNCTGCHTNGLKVPSASSSCWDCHGASATDARPNGNTFPIWSGSHTTHVVGKSMVCSDCHNGGGTGSTSHGSSNAVAKTRATVTVNSATGAFTYVAASMSCGTNYCHSSGQSTTGGATPVYPAAPVWSTTVMNCGSCHVNMDCNAAATGDHLKHAQGTANLSCATCHSAYRNICKCATHANKIIETSFSGTYATGTVYSQANQAVGNGFGTCSASKCHGQGVPVWGGVLYSATVPVRTVTAPRPPILSTQLRPPVRYR